MVTKSESFAQFSEEGAKQIKNASLDFVYIDGDHTFEGAQKDLQSWAPKVKAGGVVCGDDFNNGSGGKKYADTGVKGAVESYARAIGAEVHNLNANPANQFGFQIPFE